MKKITVLGSSGSIGKQALDVIRSKKDSLCVYGLAVSNNTDLLIRQAREFRPKVVASVAPFDTSLLPAGTNVLIGSDSATRLAEMDESDVVVNGISGFSALDPLLASLTNGKSVALANKESIVCGSSLVDNTAKKHGGIILPVDSEQSALFQCMQNGMRSEVDRLILTASGGPFWRLSTEELCDVTPEKALRHPTWSMGRKITIDSATLFNKGLEVIEAGYLFHMPADKISVLIHPQSIVHSMVSYVDGTVIANMANPDMRLAIQYAITYPNREESLCKPLNLSEIGSLSFHAVPFERFPAIKMAYDCLRAGESYPIAYNGANEAAVQAFCEGRIGFIDIVDVVDYTLQHHKVQKPTSIDIIHAINTDSRSISNDAIRLLSQEKRF